MAKYILLAMTNALPGKDAEFNEWYDNTAYPTYKSLPGLVPLGRFKSVDLPKMFPFQMDNQFEYLSLYFFEADFMEKLKATFPERPEYSFSEAIDQDRFFEPVYVAMGDVNFEPIDRFEALKR
jgi:hypothetical protein